MKLRDKKELHHKTVEELKKSIVEKQKELFDAQIEHTQGRLKNPRSLKSLRITIAQMLTIVREKDMLAERQG
jgi:ribosomal protein L29